MFKIIESPDAIPHPLALVLSYPALDFNFTSWMTPANLAVLRSEASSAFIPGLDEQKDHLSHKSPLSVVNDVQRKRLHKKKSWKRSLSDGLSASPPVSWQMSSSTSSPSTSKSNSKAASLMSSLPTTPEATRKSKAQKSVTFRPNGYLNRDDESDDDAGETDGDPMSDSEYYPLQDDEKPILARVMTSEADMYLMADGVVNPVVEESDITSEDVQTKPVTKTPFGTKLTMTSRTGFFQDRIISPSMVRTGGHVTL